MWIRIKHSLTLRIFLMTCGLMIAVCAATYGAIAYLTPLTYTSILEEELDQKTEALLTALSGREPSACDELVSTFCRETGAALRLTDAYGRILYDTISSEAYLVEGTAGRMAITTEDSETLEQDAVMQATEAGDAPAQRRASSIRSPSPMRTYPPMKHKLFSSGMERWGIYWSSAGKRPPIRRRRP